MATKTEKSEKSNKTVPKQAPPLPAKLTSELIDTYKAEMKKLEAVKQQLKPITDRTEALYDHIFGLMKATGKAVTIVGDHKLEMEFKKENVQWKSELAKRLSSEELATIQSSVGEKETLTIA